MMNFHSYEKGGQAMTKSYFTTFLYRRLGRPDHRPTAFECATIDRICMRLQPTPSTVISKPIFHDPNVVLLGRGSTHLIIEGKKSIARQRNVVAAAFLFSIALFAARVFLSPRVMYRRRGARTPGNEHPLEAA